MTKEEILAKIEEYKGRPIIVGLSDAGECLYSGIPGHWLFTQGGFIVEVKVSMAEHMYTIPAISQNIYPFKMTYVPFEIVNYVQTFMGDKPGDIRQLTEDLTPIGTTKTKEEILTEIEGNSVRKTQSVSGNLNDEHVAPGTDYGSFKGSMVSTDKSGLPQYVKDKLL